MKRRFLRQAVGWVTGSVVAIAILLGVLLLIIRSELVRQVSSFDDYITFALVQTEVDVLRVVAAAQPVALGAGLDDLRERVDVLYSRVDVVAQGAVREALHTLPAYQPTLTALNGYIAQADALLAADAQKPDAILAFARQGIDIHAQVHDLVLAANHTLVSQRAELRRKVADEVQYLVYGYLVLVAMVVIGALAVYRLFRGSEEQRLFEITDSIPGAVFQFRQQAGGEVHYSFTNRQFASIRGFDPLRADGKARDAFQVGDGWLSLVIAQDQDGLRRGLEGLQTRHEVIDVEFRIDHPQMGRRWLNLRASSQSDDGTVVSGVFFDISDRKAQEEAVAGANLRARQLSEQLVDLTDAIPGAVFQMHMRPDGWRRFLFVSRKAEDLHGKPVETLTALEGPAGFGVANAIADQQGVAHQAFMASLRSLAPVDFDILTERDGRRLWLKTMATTRRTDDGGVLFSGVWLDITDMKQQAAALEEAKRQAEEAAHAKSSFLAMMSHEIRTPMNGVMSMAEMLDQTDLSDDQRGMTSVIRQSSSALLTIINDILDFSKIEAGKLEIESIGFSLADVVEGVGELLSTRAEEYGLALTVAIDPAIADRRIGDPTRLRQMLLNLGGNAIKFTEKGGVSIEVTAVDETRLHFGVVDTGIGLTEDQRARLFQPFQQADTSTSRKFGGTGLGLSICRKLSELMGGTIGVTSTYGQGSCFWFELPLPHDTHTQPASLPDSAGARVLAVALSPQRAQIAAAYVQAGGGAFAAVDRFEDAVSALHAAKDGAGFDVMLVDAEIPDCPVRQLVSALHELVPGFAGKVVLLAPRGLASTMAMAGDAGIFATVTYPFRRQRLALVLAAALGRVELGARTVSDAGAGFMPPDIETARAAGCLILVAEDNPTNQVVIRKILSRMGFAHEIAENGRIALDMYRHGDYGLVLADFHMPEMDGLQLAAAIRADEADAGDGRHVPIVALTADALAGTAALCERAGMDGYLTKPIDTNALNSTLDGYLPQAAGLRQTAAVAKKAAKVPQGPDIDSDILDLDRLRESFGAIDADCLAFVLDFVAAAEGMVQRTAEALQASDLPQARHEAHALKGAARSTGAVRLGQLASDIQDLIDAEDGETALFFLDPMRDTWQELQAEANKLARFMAG